MTADPTMLGRLVRVLEGLERLVAGSLDGGSKPPTMGKLCSLEAGARWLPGRTDDNKRLIRERCPSYRKPGSDRDYYLPEEILRCCMEATPPKEATKPRRQRAGAPPAIPFTKPRGGRRRN